jgi:hypothetical protein
LTRIVKEERLVFGEKRCVHTKLGVSLRTPTLCKGLSVAYHSEERMKVVHGRRAAYGGRIVQTGKPAAHEASAARDSVGVRT